VKRCPGNRKKKRRGFTVINSATLELGLELADGPGLEETLGELEGGSPNGKMGNATDARILGLGVLPPDLRRGLVRIQKPGHLIPGEPCLLSHVKQHIFLGEVQTLLLVGLEEQGDKPVCGVSVLVLGQIHQSVGGEGVRHEFVGSFGGIREAKVNSTLHP